MAINIECDGCGETERVSSSADDASRILRFEISVEPNRLSITRHLCDGCLRALLSRSDPADWPRDTAPTR